MGIVGAGARFWVILDGKHRELLVTQAFQRLVVQVDVRELHRFSGEGICVHGEPMVLGGDFDFPCGQIFDRVIRSAVTELELKGFPPRASPKSW